MAKKQVCSICKKLHDKTYKELCMDCRIDVGRKVKEIIEGDTAGAREGDYDTFEQLETSMRQSLRDTNIVKSK